MSFDDQMFCTSADEKNQKQTKNKTKKPTTHVHAEFSGIDTKDEKQCRRVKKKIVINILISNEEESVNN